MAPSTIRMLTTAATLAVASVSVHAASEYKAVCVFDEASCGGQIKLREFTPNDCGGSSCSTIEGDGLNSFSALPTCTEDHLADTASHLAGFSYVIVEYYENAGCSGDFTTAVAVVADGKCYPSSDGMTGYQTTIGKDMTVSWMVHDDGLCESEAEPMSFMAKETDRSVCVNDTMKVFAYVEGDDTDSAAPKLTTLVATFVPMALALTIGMLA